MKMRAQLDDLHIGLWAYTLSPLFQEREEVCENVTAAVCDVVQDGLGGRTGWCVQWQYGTHDPEDKTGAC